MERICAHPGRVEREEKEGQKVPSERSRENPLRTPSGSPGIVLLSLGSSVGGAENNEKEVFGEIPITC